MLPALVIVAGALAAAAQPAGGPAPGQTTRAWVNACQTEAAARTGANVREACACTAGLLAGHMNERQYAILGRMAPHISDEEGLVEAMRIMTQVDGYTPQEIASVGATIAELEAKVDNVCGVLE